MLRTGHADPSYFRLGFLAQIPTAKIDQTLAQITTRLGAHKSVEFTPQKLVAHLEKGTENILVHFDADYKIDMLLISPGVATLEDALKALQPPRGAVAYLITEKGRSERAALLASEPLAVGSAFKLAVLSALRDQINRGSHRWSEVIPLRQAWKSYPSGILQRWPDGTPRTLATYAAEMISISDNTAADALIEIVGANALKPFAAGNNPFLKTREMFALKSRTGASLRPAYLGASSAQGRKRVLERIDALPMPTIPTFDTAPNLPIEWHFSVRELCRLMDRVSDLPLMSINPGVADPAAFAHVAYKGGSDLGVLNLTTMVRTRRGTTFCFSATLNDAAQALDEKAFEAAYGSALDKLADL